MPILTCTACRGLRVTKNQFATSVMQENSVPSSVIRCIDRRRGRPKKVAVPISAAARVDLNESMLNLPSNHRLHRY